MPSGPVAADLPVAVQVELTSRCNLRCAMCPLTTGTSLSSVRAEAMSDEVFAAVLDVAGRCRRVVVAGYGEPFTTRRSLDRLRALDAAGVVMHLSTNGHGVGRRLAVELAALPHLLGVNVSIDSADPAVYREVRGGEVAPVLRALRHLVAAFDDLGRLGASAVVMRSTMGSLPALPGVLADLGIRHLSLQGVVDSTPYAEGQRLLGAVVSPGAGLDDVVAAAAVAGVEVELSLPERSEADVHDPGGAERRWYGSGGWDTTRTRQCFVPWELPFVDADGRVFPCCVAGAAGTSQLGDLAVERFDEVWDGQPFRDFRLALVDGRTTPEVCRRCTIAPLGEHVFRSWAASVIEVAATIGQGARPEVVVRVRNEGTRPWWPSDQVRLGTAGPRDCASPFAHPTWLGPNRVGSFEEDVVAPGDLATFRFLVEVAAGTTARGALQVVVEDVCWVAGTTFDLTLEGPRPPWRLQLRALLRGAIRRG